MTSDARRKGGAPAWATIPLKNALVDIERVNDVLHISMNGISKLKGMPGLVQVLQDLDGVIGRSQKANRASQAIRARKEARMASREVRDGFPLLHQQATILLYSALEATVKDLLTAWITNRPDALEIEKIQKIKVPIAEFIRQDSEHQSMTILHALERETDAPLKSGVGRFEALLKVFGLDGPVPDEVRKNLQELAHVRHTIVHHRARADARLIENCPWLGLKEGDVIIVKHDDWSRYRSASLKYITELVCRVGEKYGRDVRTFLAKQEERRKKTGAKSSKSPQPPRPSRRRKQKLSLGIHS